GVYSRILFIFLCIAALPAFAQKSIRVISPDGHIIFTLKVTADAPVYQVSYKGKTLIQQSELGLLFKDEPGLAKGLRIEDSRYEQVDDTYDLVVGKTKTVRNQHNSAVIRLAERGGKQRQLDLAVRVFDDGVAFRYEFPRQDNWTSYMH